MKLPVIFRESAREMNTIANVKRPSVNAPFAMSTFKRGPRPIPGKVSRMSRTPQIDPTTFTSENKRKDMSSKLYKGPN